MRKTIAAVTVAALFLMLAPIANGAESVSRDYTGSAGYFLGPHPGRPEGWPLPFSGKGLAIMCPHTCWYEDDQIREDLDGDSENGYEIDQKSPVPLYDQLPDFGGADIQASTTYNSVVIKPNDDLYGTGAAISACFYDPAGDNVCEGDPSDGDNDYGSDWVCGSVPLVGAPFAQDYVIVWALTILITEDLGACGAVAGTMTADFFTV